MVAMSDKPRTSKRDEYRALSALGLSPRQIAARCNVSRTTVREALGADPRPPSALERDDGSNVPCTYCGLPGVIVDRVKQPATDQGPAWVKAVSSCLECKAILSRERAHDLTVRKALVKARLRERYDQALNLPDWSESELRELAAPFRAFVMQAVHRKAAIQDRLRW